MIPSTGIVRATSNSSRVQAHRRTAQLLHHLQLSTTSRQTLRSMSFPTTIQAIAIDKIGDIDVVEKKAVPFPAHVPGNVVVKVHYAGVNFIDTYYRKGLYPIKSFPQVLGMEASGVVAALPTDENVLKDEEFKKRGLKIGSKVAVNFLGVHGEYASVPWAKVFPVPESVSLRTAGAALLQGLTAVTFVEEAYNVKQGDYVLIHTVAGGLGLLLCQLVKHRGGVVIGTTSSKEKAEIAAAHGADYVILYPVENTVERVLEITHGEGVHVVYDGVGKDTFMDNFKLTRRKGTMISVGNASGAVEPVAPLKLVEKNLVLLRPTMANYIYTPEEARYYGTKLFDLIASGVLKINIFKEYPFTTAGAQEAQGDLTVRSGKTVGKLIIKVAEE